MPPSASGPTSAQHIAMAVAPWVLEVKCQPITPMAWSRATHLGESISPSGQPRQERELRSYCGKGRVLQPARILPLPSLFLVQTLIDPMLTLLMESCDQNRSYSEP